MAQLPLTEENLDELFTYHPPTTEARKAAHKAVNDATKECARAIMRNVPDSPEKTLAIRAIIEARMQANAACAFYMERDAAPAAQA